MSAWNKDETPKLIPRLHQTLEEARTTIATPMSEPEAKEVLEANRRHLIERGRRRKAAAHVGGVVLALAGIGWAGNQIVKNANPHIIHKTQIEQRPDYANGPTGFGEVAVTTDTPEHNK